MLFFCLFDNVRYDFDKVFQKNKAGQYHAAYAVERIEIVNDIVEAEETQRVCHDQTTEDDDCLIFVI